jgi:hypothetical protein
LKSDKKSGFISRQTTTYKPKRKQAPMEPSSNSISIQSLPKVNKKRPFGRAAQAAPNKKKPASNFANSFDFSVV